EHRLIGRATQVVLITADVTGRFQEWSRKGVRFLSSPRLRRIKYDPAPAAPAPSPRLLGDEAPVWGSVSARFRDIDGNTFSLVSGDVIGKGMAAALLMANLQANLRSQVAFALDEPGRLLQSVNQLFCENSPEGAFASLFFADYHDPTGALRYVNCGHLCALVLRRDGTLDRLEPTSTLLGLFPQWECSGGG